MARNKSKAVIAEELAWMSEQYDWRYEFLQRECSFTPEQASIAVEEFMTAYKMNRSNE